jgi:hypothetical protein
MDLAGAWPLPTPGADTGTPDTTIAAVGCR